MSIKLKNYVLDSLGAVKEVNIEVEILPGFPDFKIIGIPSQNTFGHKERLRFSIKNSGYKYSHARQVVSITPTIEKCDSEHIDLPIAVAALNRTGQAKLYLDNLILFGKLGLDGSLHSTATLDFILKKIELNNFNKILLPIDLQKDAFYQNLSNVIFCKNLIDALKTLSTKNLASPALTQAPKAILAPSFENIIGLEYVKKAIVLAVARHHKVLIIGFPGIGKTMLTKSIVNLSNSVLELLPVSPKSTFIKANINQNIFSLNPGATIVINELSELKTECLEVLRYLMDQPNESSLVATMNPCRCGYFGHPSIPCKCTPQNIQSYNKKLPRPFLDRFDIVINLNTEPNVLGQQCIANFKQTNLANQFIEYSDSFTAKVSMDFLENQLDAKSKILLKELTLKYSLSLRRIFKILDFAYSLSLYRSFINNEKEKMKITEADLIESLAYQSYVIPKIKDTLQSASR